eukprot:1613587-Rhodomonas_salina.7
MLLSGSFSFSRGARSLTAGSTYSALARASQHAAIQMNPLATVLACRVILTPRALRTPPLVPACLVHTADPVRSTTFTIYLVMPTIISNVFQRLHLPNWRSDCIVLAAPGRGITQTGQGMNFPIFISVTSRKRSLREIKEI